MTDEKEWSEDDSEHRLENKTIPPRASAAIQAAKAAAAATGARVSETRKAKRER
ncbi:hypothetical protein [Demequina zhanjiangensis]|uniref:Uncharacterized protein n=1 Tax=Demequina zhanjiangensis TaxID=3051659 RepID=A0ABT8G428_9MICO|nr:hypothetical protein [Demequina sp. SYSU T00b26]MDN4473890.1 hypothetical protein [Demequina sp. SYSU T00b26]